MAARLVEMIRRAPVISAALRPRRLSGRLQHGWRVYLMDPASGQLGPTLDVTSGSWSIELNGTESGSVALRKTALAGVDSRWFAPWAGGLLFTYTFEGVERPIVAGPITGWPSEDQDTIQFSFSGPRKILEKRLAIREGTYQAVLNAQADVAQSKATSEARAKAVTDAQKLVDELAKVYPTKIQAARAAVGLPKTTGKVLFSDAAPATDRAKANLWIRTTDDTPHVWDGKAWVAKTTQAQVSAAGEAHAAYDNTNDAKAALANAKTAAATAKKTYDAASKTLADGFRLNVTGTTPGGLIWSLAEAGQAKPGGDLPIVRGTPAEAGTVSRTYEWWNLANLAVDKLITEISEEETGPDVMLRPEWTSEDQRAIRWRLVTGTAASPVIGQTWIPDWDTTAAKANVEAVSVRSSADHLVTRVWATGAGEGAGTVIRRADDLSFVEARGLFLETVVSNTSEANGAAIDRLAKSTLAASGDMLDQVSLGLRANDAKAPLGTWFVGDKANVTLKGWLSIPDGTRAMRIIQLSGDLTDKINTAFQEDAF